MVQALRYEEIKQDYADTDSPLRDFLLDTAEKNEYFAHSLHWHLELERNNDSNAPKMLNFYEAMWDDLMRCLEERNYVVH